MGLAEHLTPPYVHEGLLLVIALVVAGGCFTAALLLRSRAPAVSIALSGAVVFGTVTLFVSSAHDRHGVPQDVGVWASVGLWVGGTIGLVVTRGRPPSRSFWLIALTSLILAPFGAALLLLSVQQACPLYVTERAGYCFYDFDLLGGWAAGVAILFIVDVIAIVAILLIAGWQAKRAEGIRLGDDEWANV
jgi:hypothetical protein